MRSSGIKPCKPHSQNLGTYASKCWVSEEAACTSRGFTLPVIPLSYLQLIWLYLFLPRHAQVSPPRTNPSLPVEGIPTVLPLPSFWKVDYSGFTYVIPSIHFTSHHKQAPAEVTDNYLPSECPNSKGILTSPNYWPFCSISHCRPLPLWNSLSPDFNDTWLSLVSWYPPVFFSRLFSLYTIYIPPEWVTPKVLATTGDSESRFLLYTSLLNEPVIQHFKEYLSSHIPDKPES